MKKTIKISFTLFVMVALSTLSFTNAYADGENEKACVLTIASPDTADIECKGEGTICSSNQECYREFNPKLE